MLDGEFPHITTVTRMFGSWNAAIEAAGLTPRERGRSGRPGDDPEIVAETIRLYQSGLSLRVVAMQMGCHPQTVRHRLIRAGVLRRNTRSAAA